HREGKKTSKKNSSPQRRRAACSAAELSLTPPSHPTFLKEIRICDSVVKKFVASLVSLPKGQLEEAERDE
ncbi:MAG: hypothetical protein AAF517_26300, partial [Planctomycetota bacterium]